uniref:Uncharacterized protein n=1 Tax=Vitis vinifera TaxID=29760 RepID=A5AN92_VITVI|nr:hypothetical protein VITISV_008281 [Vitis vinifera]
MARTRGAKSSSPSTCLRIPRDTSVQGSTSKSPWPRVVPSPVEGRTHQSSAQAVPVPQKKIAKVSEPIDLTESSSEPESEPMPSPQPAKKSPPPTKKPQPSQTPAKESQIPSSMTLEVRDPTVIHFTIDGRHGILGARHIADALNIPYEPACPGDFRAWTHPSQSDIVHTLSRGASSRHYILRNELPPSMFLIDALIRHNIFPLQHWVQRIGVLLEALFRISEGYFFGLHHLIMVVLLYFEEKVHWKKLPTLVVAPTEPIPEVAPSAPQATPQTLPVIPPILEPSPSAEPRIAIPIIEYRGLYHTFQALATSRSILTQQITALRAYQEQIITTQAQHTAILRQIQHHLGIISAPEHASLSPPEPSQAPPFIHETMPPKEPTIGEAEAVEPPSPQHPPPTI